MTSQCSSRIPSFMRIISAANPVDRQPEAREAAVDDDEVSLRYDYSRLIPASGRDALDQVEETVAARLDVRTVLNIVCRPRALRCFISSPFEYHVQARSSNLLTLL